MNNPASEQSCVSCKMSCTDCVVVTGAASGIGRSICQELVRRGVVTVLWDVDQAGLNKLEDELCAIVAGKAKGYLVDVTNHGQVSEVTSKVEAEIGPITCLVNNAGVSTVPCLFKNGQIEKMMKVVNVNTIGTLNVTSAIFPLMAGRKSGHVVNISSVCGKSATQNHVVYSATKHFVEGFSQGLRREGLRDGVKVTVIRPGAVKTSLDAFQTSVSAVEEIDPESRQVQTEKMALANPDIPWAMEVEEVGRMVAHVICLPYSVAINELNIAATGLPE